MSALIQAVVICLKSVWLHVMIFSSEKCPADPLMDGSTHRPRRCYNAEPLLATPQLQFSDPSHVGVVANVERLTQSLFDWQCCS